MQSEVKKIIFFTNIVAPYRIFLFNKLEEVKAKESSFEFEVYFMRMTEADRDWDVNLDDLKFKYSIGKGFYLMIRGFHFHFNPLLVLKLIRSKHEIILGSSWNDFNVLSIALLKKIGLVTNKISVWSEANYLTTNNQKKSKFRDRLRKWFFSQVDGSFIVPGKMSILSFKRWGIPFKDIIILPNLVSNSMFERTSDYKCNIDGKPVVFLVARLEEHLKGIKNFLESIGQNNLRKVIVRIAGTGSSKKDYIDYIKFNKLEDNIFLLGNLSQEQISLEYKNAHIFALPSYSDPSPLALVEAIFSGLPVLVSERCGNHFEAVINGENGYTFDPFDPEDIKTKFNTLLSQNNYWGDFSKRSVEIARANFNAEIVLTNFVQSVNKY